MDSAQIEKIFKNDKRFIGVFPRDSLPVKIEQVPCGLIINTDGAKETGEHWVAISIVGYKRGEYFDSFGLPPLHRDLTSFLNRNCSNGWIYNSCTIQHYQSKSCGQFCIKYLKSRFKNISFHNFISQFSVNLKKNEEILKNV
jgi:hypothetical protein